VRAAKACSSDPSFKAGCVTAAAGELQVLNFWGWRDLPRAALHAVETFTAIL
jgi:hypothetical protein